MLRDLVPALVDLVAPRACAGCGAPGPSWCPRCARCLSGPAVRAVPDPCPPQLPRTYAVSPYDGPVRAALLAHKERGRLGLAAPLGDALGCGLAALATDPATGPLLRAALRAGVLVVVPVPSTAAATRARGHDPVLRMTRRAAAFALPGARVERLLRTARGVTDSAGQGSDARWADVDSRHSVSRRAAPGVVAVLTDDLMTTGASLVAARRALEARGVPVLGAAVVAATRRRRRQVSVDTPPGPASRPARLDRHAEAG